MIMRARYFEDLDHGEFHKPWLGVQGFPKKRNFVIFELTHTLCLEVSQKGKPDLQGCSLPGKQGEELLV